MIVAVKNLVAERARFVLSVVGVAVAVILVLVMSGIFVGTTNQVTTYIDHSKGAVWVVQPGVSQMFRAVSWLPAEGKDRLLKVPGVQSAEPILGLPSDFVHKGGHTAYFVVGYDTATGIGGPWSLAEGAMSRGLVKWCWIECWRRRIRSISATPFGLWTVTLRSWACPNRPRPSAISTPSSPSGCRASTTSWKSGVLLPGSADSGFTGDQVVDSVRKSVPGMDASPRKRSRRTAAPL